MKQSSPTPLDHPLGIFPAGRNEEIPGGRRVAGVLGLVAGGRKVLEEVQDGGTMVLVEVLDGGTRVSVEKDAAALELEGQIWVVVAVQTPLNQFLPEKNRCDFLL